jgi:hypothetical protein
MSEKLKKQPSSNTLLRQSTSRLHYIKKGRFRDNDTDSTTIEQDLKNLKLKQI